jgi:hypothetical protein
MGWCNKAVRDFLHSHGYVGLVTELLAVARVGMRVAALTLVRRKCVSHASFGAQPDVSVV